MGNNSNFLKSIFISLLCIYSTSYAQDDMMKQQELAITTSTTETNDNHPVITKWMMTTFIIAGSVITFWALCICALACILLRLYIRRKTKVRKGDPVRNNSHKSVNDSSDTCDHDTGDHYTGDPVSDISNTPKIIGRKPTATKRYSLREITMDHCVLQNRYNSAPTNSVNHYKCKPQLSQLSQQLSNDSHPLRHGEYYHPQPPSVDITTLKQLMCNTQFSNDSSLDTVMNINKSKVIDSETEEVNIQIMEEMDGESRASDDDIYIKPKSGDIQTPTLGVMITPNGNDDITPNGCSDNNDSESKDGFPDTGLIGDAQHIHTQSINMEETHDNDGTGYTSSSYTETEQTDNLNVNKQSNNNKENPPPTVISDHSVYPSIPSIAIPNGPSSNSTAPRDMMPSSFSAIYDKCVTPDGLNINMFNTTTATTTTTTTTKNNGNIGIHSVLQQSTNGPSIFKSLTQQSKTATPTYQLPKYNVTKGQWM